MKHKDLTIIFYTANEIPDYFMKNVQKQLFKAVGDTPIISVSFEPMDLGQNICIGRHTRSNYMLYKQVMMGALMAKTKYVATAEDDCLYPKEHFMYRPSEDTIAYDLNKWSMFTWTKPPIFSKRENRRTMTSCIAPRDTLVRTLEERYTRWPDFDKIPKDTFKYYWGEPGRFENHLGITPIKTETFECEVPTIMFSTPEALGFQHLGTRKAHTNIQTKEVPGWGTAEEIRRLYSKS